MGVRERSSAYDNRREAAPFGRVGTFWGYTAGNKGPSRTPQTQCVDRTGCLSMRETPCLAHETASAIQRETERASDPV